MSKNIISPIAIDLGAKNTGVLYSHYEEGSKIEDIPKLARTYKLEKDAYTLLMNDRTAKRHARRGIDRRQMVKRLFRLIWENHFKLDWNNDVQQTISFLLNRRGFNFLTADYDENVLEKFPLGVLGKFSQEVSKEFSNKLIENTENTEDNTINLTSTIEKLSQDQSELEKVYKFLEEEPKKLAQRKVIFTIVNKIKEVCEKLINNENFEEKPKGVKLSQTSKWIIEELQNKGAQELNIDFQGKNTFNLLKYLEENKHKLEAIKSSLPDYTEEEKKIKESIWDFKPTTFKIETEGIWEEENNKNFLKNHLNHLTFTLHKILVELQSGGRHRSKYFEEVFDVLKEDKHTHGYLNNNLSIKTLTNLIGHLSNLELKTLRKYFNNENYKKGDQWDCNRFTEKFCHWVINEWRVNPQKDKDKAENGQYPYQIKDEKLKLKKKSLRKQILAVKKGEKNVIDFFLDTCPNWTIPPYQDNNNRRPPRCQSFVLNAEYLNSKYADWKNWLNQLKDTEECKTYLENFEEDLKNLSGTSQKVYFSKIDEKKYKDQRNQDDLQTRVLQFIFDQVKGSDSFKLNEIYSYAKKLKQNQSTEEEREKFKSKLEKIIETSILPQDLKTPRNYNSKSLFSENSFLHLISKYYKLRQRAKDGRIFIHPEYKDNCNKNRGYEKTHYFDDKKHLLTYCNLKTRQKRYSSLNDIAGVLQIKPDLLKCKIKDSEGESDDEKLITWLKSFKGLPTNCANSEKMQKEHKGYLKQKLDKAFFRQEIEGIRKKKNKATAKELTKFNKYSHTRKPTKEENDLCNLDNKIKNIAFEIGKKLFEESIQKNDKRIQKFHSIFSFAQINNIAFKDRSGNSNTCPICSMDNSKRMEEISWVNENKTQESTKAQRLPAISTRLIDGAVMRMARIVGKAIANEKWEVIRKDLSQEKQITIPIITELNSFEFEPNLRELKAKKPEENKQSTVKDDRIKEASQKICPYTGETLNDNGEIDHIIPRSSQWGILNDEANLIYASNNGNQTKGNSTYYLKDLSKKYKETIFNTSQDTIIESEILKKIWDESEQKIYFNEVTNKTTGEITQDDQYRNFINLTPDEQKALRHSLFLEHPIREQAILLINNRNRALVNGTQRYFAETIANEINKLAKKENLKNISFDYFSVDAKEISTTRKSYTQHEKFKEFQKESEEQKGQTPISHSIDAFIAFTIASSRHQNYGSLKVKFKNDEDSQNNVFKNNAFKTELESLKDSFKEIELKRTKPTKDYFEHRQMTRDGIYAEHYLAILIDLKNQKIACGFAWNNCITFNTDKKFWKGLPFVLKFSNCGSFNNNLSLNNFEDLKVLLQSINTYINKETIYISFNLHKIHQFLVENYNTKKGYQKFPEEVNFLRSLAYRTEKKSIKSIDDVQTILNKKSHFKIKHNNIKCDFPSQKQWKNLFNKWSEKPETQNDNNFLKNFFNTTNHENHEKVRKVFSLPIITAEGKLLIKRKSWNNQSIFQIVNDSDSRKVDTKFFVPAFDLTDQSIERNYSSSAFQI